MAAIPNLEPAEAAELIRYVRTLRPRNRSTPARREVKLVDGGNVSGVVQNQSLTDLQLLGDDRRVHLLRTAGDRFRPVTSQVDWPSCNGDTRGYRYSSSGLINTSNVSRLVPKWLFNLPNTARLQGTPIVVEGVMYVTSGNECYALDAGTGRQIWHYQRVRTTGVIGNAGGGINRGAAVSGNRLFMVTDNAHVIALDRFTGALLWDTEMADWRQNYGATGAPLVVGNLVVSGVSGGDEGVRPLIARTPQGRELLVVPQKSGMTYALDPDRNGDIVWEYRFGEGSALGAQWGAAADERNVYVGVGGSLSSAPGGMHAIDLTTGKRVWSSPAQAKLCAGGAEERCYAAQGGAVTVIPGVVFSGGSDGGLRAYSTRDGSIVWQVDTNREFQTVNGVKANGATIDGAGPVIVDGMRFVNSGYSGIVGRAGNVLLAFQVQ
jgi:glucose dehydrogenase